jgi:hypothetical protein
VLEEHVPNYRDRLAVPAGITGLAQINLPPDSTLNSVRRKQCLDLEYIRRATPLLDLRIMLATLLRMLGMRGKSAARLCGLHWVPRNSNQEYQRPLPARPSHDERNELAYTEVNGAAR